MSRPGNPKKYHRELKEALADDFLGQAMDNFALAYGQSRRKAFAGLDLDALVRDTAAIKAGSARRMDELYALFKERAESAGVRVGLARTAGEAGRMILEIAREAGCTRVVKSKSMTAEEIGLNRVLEQAGIETTETDLGEWIIQLRGEGPSHMVMPAIHLSRFQAAELFSGRTGERVEPDIPKLVRTARKVLREKFFQADMGISGANFALAESGAVGIVTNEGNARLVTTLPRVHVVLAGLDKLLPGLDQALRILEVLPRNATAQAMTSYVTWISGRNQCAASPDGKKRIHVIFLDNGRRAMAQDPEFAEALNCVRCGACANVCPVYRSVGGHKFGHIYIGAIGLVLTYFFHGSEKAADLIKNCVGCGKCKEVCAAGIDLPRMIMALRGRLAESSGRGLGEALLNRSLKSPKMLHSLLKAARYGQKPLRKGETVRPLSFLFGRDADFRVLPALADQPFRERFAGIKPVIDAPRGRVGIFSGCLQDFVYPEQLEAALRIFARLGLEPVLPGDQSCCGLPALMTGDADAARAAAIANARAFKDAGCERIVTLCASCASHIRLGYPPLAPDSAETAGFSARVEDFGSFLARELAGVENPRDLFPGAAERQKLAFHLPCHLVRLGGSGRMAGLVRALGGESVRTREEESCCGFGGGFSFKFPEVSARILKRKLDDLEQSGAGMALTECPGCLMQLRGGLTKRNSALRALHTAEWLAGLLAEEGEQAPDGRD